MRAVAFVVACGLYGQLPPPSFEAAVVKPNLTAVSVGMKFDPQYARWTGISLRLLLGAAFALRDEQIVGGPSWVGGGPLGCGGAV